MKKEEDYYKIFTKKIEAYFPKSPPLKKKDFFRVEVLLYLFHQLCPEKDAREARLLLSGLDQIGRWSFERKDFMMQQAKKICFSLQSSHVWEDRLGKYNQLPENIRLYDFNKEGRLVQQSNIVFSQRTNLFHEMLSSPLAPSRTKPPLASFSTRYSFEHQSMKETIVFPSTNHISQKKEKIRTRKGGPLRVTRQELLNAAQEMDRFLPENWYSRIHTIRWKKIEGEGLVEEEEFSVRELCHVIGMVGAGKSSLMHVFTFWAAKNGYRVVLVMDSVAECMHTVSRFQCLGIQAVPLLGKTNRIEQMEKVAGAKESFLPPRYSRHLATLCPLDGLRNREIMEALPYGREPCYHLQSEHGKGEDFVCPFYFLCPSKEDERALVEAPIVVTTPAGWMNGRAPSPLVGNMRFFEMAMEHFDLVIFDEADRVQTFFDSSFCPTVSIDQLIAAHSDLSKRFMEAQGERLGWDADHHRYCRYLMSLPFLCDGVKRLIGNNKDIHDWSRIGKGESFSALQLLEKSDDFPPKLKKELLACIKDEETSRKIRHWLLEIRDDSDTTQLVEEIREEVRKETGDDKIWSIRVEFILRLIVLEERLRQILYERDGGIVLPVETSEKVTGFLRNRYYDLRQYLPAAAPGNLFGFIYKREKKVLHIYRQLAFGRQLMTGLPYLRLDEEGRPAGPHTLLLSGTSWAKGSAKYHVWAPVHYILETEKEKREKISRTRMVDVTGEIRVSGNTGEERMVQLHELLQRCQDYFRFELKRVANGKILVVVNSYKEAEEAAKNLGNLLPEAPIARLMRDGDEDADQTVKRKNLKDFSETDYRILVAPSGAIERGHNIVDEIGHSALSAIFFVVRPMSHPDDVAEAVTRLNGWVAEYAAQWAGGEDRLNRARKIRSKAASLWQQMLTTSFSGLDYTSEQEMNEIAVSRLVIIHQIFGRLARIADLERPDPAVYFADGAFRRKDGGQFDLLQRMLRWLKQEIEEGTKRDRAIAETLYGPFYRACQKGGLL